MLATLVGLSLLLALVGGTATLVGCLLARRLRARQARRHPQQAAVRERTRQARRLAAEWPLLAQTLGLGYRDQWTRQHRFPTAEFVADDQGVTATVAAIAGAGLADYQRAAGVPGRHLGLCHRPGRATRTGPDPAARPAPGPAAAAGPGRPVRHGPGVPDLVVAGLGRGQLPGHRSGWPRSPASWSPGWPGSARPCSSPTSSASSPPPQPCSSCSSTARAAPTTTGCSRGPGCRPRTTWTEVRDVLRRVHRLMVDRQAAIAQVLGRHRRLAPRPVAVLAAGRGGDR